MWPDFWPTLYTYLSEQRPSYDWLPPVHLRPGPTDQSEEYPRCYGDHVGDGIETGDDLLNLALLLVVVGLEQKWTAESESSPLTPNALQGFSTGRTRNNAT